MDEIKKIRFPKPKDLLRKAKDVFIVVGLSALYFLTLQSLIALIA